MLKTLRFLLIFMTILLSFITFSAKAQSAPAWQPNTAYAVNSLVSYGGATYKCIQAHTSLPGWEPPNVPALWQLQSGTPPTATKPPATNTQPGPTNTTRPSNTPTRTTVPPTATTGGPIPAWSGNGVPYKIGDLVTFQGSIYKCTYAHTSQSDWSPTAAPTLWQLQQSATFQPATSTRTGPTPTLGPPPSRMFAPYIDVSPGSSSAIMQLASNGSGNKFYTLAFILGRGCTASWFGAYELNSPEADALGTRINELRAAGGDVIVAFGGAAAPELANVCTSVSALQAQYQAVISKYNLRYVDFDIEDFSPTAIDLRNKALKGLEAANPNLKVHYTLGVLESGFTAPQNDVLNNAKANGTRVDLVNIMVMDYGHPVSDMAAAAISAAQNARNQLNGMGFTSTQLGITPMIGVNDSAGETFTLANASTVLTWAKNNNVALLAFWSVNRDNGGCPGGGAASPSCSGVSQALWGFSKIFQGF